jgi:hypothetical protein
MGWEESMFSVFDDLEQQAAGLHLVERDAEVAGLSLAEYTGVTLRARLHASLERDLRVRLVGGLVLSGRLARVGEDWLLLAAPAAEWIVRHEGVASLGGLSPRADSEESWSVTDRLSLRSLLRRLSAGNEPCLVHLVDDQRMEGRVGRVGADFFELHVGQGPEGLPQLLPVSSVSALQGRME